MIPPDLAARLRMLTEASFLTPDQPTQPVQQASRVQAIQSQFPELTPGTRFTALVQRPLPDGTFRAMVAGQEVTLALNTAAKTGDSLELVVTQTTAKAVFAQLASEQGTTDTSQSSARASLSQTGRLINALLTGQPESPAIALKGGAPLLASAPASANAAGTLAQQLSQAVTQSGLFYESHLADWLAGKFSTAQLQQEPQGQATPAQAGTAAPQAAAAATTTPSSSSPAQSAVAVDKAGTEPGTAASTTTQTAGANEASQTLAPVTSRGATIPEQLFPVVQQQLDNIATQNLVLQGQAWPGQVFQLEIEDPRERGRDAEGSPDDDAPDREWRTTLRLHMPHIGSVEARMVLNPAGLALHLSADDATAVAQLQAGQDMLAAALDAAGLPVSGMQIDRSDGDR